jgi:hypothetical protein
VGADKPAIIGINLRKAHQLLWGAMARQEDSAVLLSGAKHLEAHPERPFAAAQGDTSQGERPFAAAQGDTVMRIGADKSAMGTINRPLQMSGLVCKYHNRAQRFVVGYVGKKELFRFFLMVLMRFKGRE